MVNKNDAIVVMTKKELDDLVYYACDRASRRSNDKLFAGISPFLYELQEDFRRVIKELDYLKLRLKTNNNINESEAKTENENFMTDSFKYKFFDSLSADERQRIEKSFKDSLENININSWPNVKVPKFKLEINHNE